MQAFARSWHRDNLVGGDHQNPEYRIAKLHHQATVKIQPDGTRFRFTVRGLRAQALPRPVQGQASCFLMHAAFHERAPLQKMDGRVFLLSLRLALSLKLSHSRVFSLRGCICRRGQRTCKQANCDNGECGFHGRSSLRRSCISLLEFSNTTP